MTRPYKELYDKLPQATKERIARKTKILLAEMRLQDLREAHQLSQKRMAEILSTNQANISRIERRADMYISTLRGYIEAMGGKLDIIAKFPSGEIYINQFEDLDNDQKSEKY